MGMYAKNQDGHRAKFRDKNKCFLRVLFPICAILWPHFKDSLSTTMQRAPKRRFRGPRNPKVLRRRLRAVEICLHPSHPSVEWIEIFLWSYEIYQGTIGAVLIEKMFYSSGHKSDIRTLDVSHSSQQTSETTRKVFIYTSYQNNVTMDDPVSS